MLIIIVELDVAHSMSQDFGGTSSGASQGAGGRRLDGDRLDHTLIKFAFKWQTKALITIAIMTQLAFPRRIPD